MRRLTGWDSLKEFMDELGFISDSNSQPNLGEWYWILNGPDYLAIYCLLLDRPWIDYRVSDL